MKRHIGDGDLEQGRSLKRGLFSSQKETPLKLEKVNIVGFLTELFKADLSAHLLADIISGYEDGVFVARLTVVGRPETLAGQKQLRHVTPFSFVKEIIDSAVRNSHSLHEIFSKLAQIAPLFSAQSEQGYYFSTATLQDVRYQQIAGDINNSASRVLVSGESSGVFVSPAKVKLPQDVFTPGKVQLAKQQYSEHHPDFIKAILGKFSEILLTQDTNTIGISIEVISRFIFTLFNTMQNAVFAHEGHSMIHEIRLYESKEAAQESTKCSYEFMTALELKEIYDKKGSDFLNGRIRVVNCEGADIKKAAEALGLLDVMQKDLQRDQHISHDRIDRYNKDYNKKIKLANIAAKGLELYNSELRFEQNKLHYFEFHIAKLLYSVFDLKPLDKLVFKPTQSKNNVIESYNGANKTAKLLPYEFANGVEYRQFAKDAEGVEDDSPLHRSENQDFDLLAKKLVQHFIISVLPFSSFNFTTNVAISKKIFESLINLAKLDYELADRDNDMVKFSNSAAQYLDSYVAKFDSNVTYEASFIGDNSHSLQTLCSSIDCSGYGSDSELN